MFRWYFKYWSSFAPIYQRKTDSKHQRYLYIFYAVLYHFLYSVYYQFSMTIGLFEQRNAHDILNNLVYLMSSYTYSTKLFSIFLHKKDVKMIIEISRHLDKQIGDCHVQSENVNRFKKTSSIIQAIYIVGYGIVVFFGGKDVIILYYALVRCGI